MVTFEDLSFAVDMDGTLQPVVLGQNFVAAALPNREVHIITSQADGNTTLAFVVNTGINPKGLTVVRSAIFVVTDYNEKH